jgi:SAM-dependent methyltransferase
MSPDDRFLSAEFPLSSKYHPDWIIKNGATGSGNTLWLTEWLAEAMDLKAGMRVLDLGCGRAISSIFLAREFSVQVWATDLWIGASENLLRIRDAGLEEQVFPIHADARALPYAGAFFDAILSIDSYPYYGTDSLYLNYIAHFLEPSGQIGIAGACLVREFTDGVPEHLREMWTQDLFAFHTRAWWKQHWERTGIVDVEICETRPDGWRHWLDWQTTAHPDNTLEIESVRADGGRYLGQFRMVGRRNPGARLEDYCWPDTMRSFPMDYEPRPLLRT